MPISRVLKKDFFNRPAPEVSRDLLGKYLVKQEGKEKLGYKIIEAEAYDGPEDKASHASRGKTSRNEIMFGPAGYFYVYLVYGIHHMLNVVTGKKGYPAAVLIRGIEGFAGPGKLTRELEIDLGFNKKFASPENGLWLEDRGVEISDKEIKKNPRVGVDYAGSVWSQKPYRFVLKKRI